MKTSLLLSLLFLVSAFSAHALTVDVSELRGRSGNLMIAVFNDPGQFPDRKPVLAKIVEVAKAQTVSVDLNLPNGDYAISIFMDENKNGKLDTNILRIPKELFGFSNNPRILTGPPSFQDCEVQVTSPSQKIQLRLIKLI